MRTFKRLTVSALLLMFVGTSLMATNPAFDVKIYGTGNPVIFIPGLACSGEIWTSTVERYSSKFECHVLTLAGFAGVPTTDGDFIETVRREIAGYIHSHKLNKPIIVGHSIGGLIALAVASHDPNLVGKLIIVDAFPFLPAAQMPTATVETIKPQAEMLRSMISKQTAEQYRQSQPAVLMTMMSDSTSMHKILEWGLASDREAVGRAMYGALTTDLREAVSTITSPTVVLGTWIAYKPFGATRESTRHAFEVQYANMPHCEIRMAEHARHFIMVDDPAWFFQQLDEVLLAEGGL